METVARDTPGASWVNSCALGVRCHLPLQPWAGRTGLCVHDASAAHGEGRFPGRQLANRDGPWLTVRSSSSHSCSIVRSASLRSAYPGLRTPSPPLRPRSPLGGMCLWGLPRGGAGHVLGEEWTFRTLSPHTAQEKFQVRVSGARLPPRLTSHRGYDRQTGARPVSPRAETRPLSSRLEALSARATNKQTLYLLEFVNVCIISHVSLM